MDQNARLNLLVTWKVVLAAICMHMRDAAALHGTIIITFHDMP